MCRVHIETMPKEPKRKNLKKPLRMLRGALGITQAELASLSGIPIDTIRSHENGRITELTRDVGHKISVEMGGSWDAKTERWVTGSGTSLTREFFEQYRQALTSEPTADMQKLDLFAINQRIELLFESVPKQLWTRRIYQFEEYLEECRREFAPTNDELKAAFAATRFQLMFIYYGQTKIPSVLRYYPQAIREIQRRAASKLAKH